ncbi:hypothetical protein D3C78_796800 [compost metagenome]
MRLAQRRTQLLHEVGLQATHRQPASVARAVVVVEASTVEHLVLAPRRHAARQITRTRHRIQAERAIGHAHIQVLALPAVLAGNHRRQQADDSVQRSTGDVRRLNPQRQWPAVLASGVTGHSRQRQVIDVVPGAILVRTGLAIAGDRHVNQPRIDRPQCLIAQPQALHHARAKLLKDNVMVLQQLLDHLQRLGLLEIQRQAALVAIEVGVAGRDALVVGRQYPQQVHAGRRLDAHYLGAHVRQQQRGKRPRQQCREIQNLE